MAKLYFNYGTMNAGKSINLIKDAHNYDELGRFVLVLKPALDDRGQEGYINCRVGGFSRRATLFGLNDNLASMITEVQDELYAAGNALSAVFIDEAQFMTRDQVFQASHIPDFLDVPVLCYGLHTDAFGHLFEGSAALFAMADVLNEIKTMCAHSDKKATMVYRVDSYGNPVRRGASVLIGGNDQYRSCSRREYKKAVFGLCGKERDWLLHGSSEAEISPVGGD